ncbi:MAG TPA: hypothetical protein DDX39_06505 [Bacteroidales bacterium]|nr:MAG: hypothetical protein A2W98_05060 [Bacteroidetes bacterium GWF2_33_38]OFY91902.1 MAG: hypothetical protein A2236_13535 [Bacteroidetes bacterium RIFOXYA2_FULL_33_7]HBF88277.1 hypothetical protein [Bacteroidales bacterium]
MFCFSQSNIILIENDVTKNLEYGINSSDLNIHTASKPYVYNNIAGINVDSLLTPFEPKNKYKHNIFLRKLLVEDLVNVDTSEFYLDVNFLLDYSKGLDILSDSALNYNIRGVMVRGKIAEKLSFVSVFQESQAFFPDYIASFINYSRVVPGRGRTKGLMSYGYDFAPATGHLSYSPNQFFNLQVGHGKNVIGEGYRSLLLSDVSPAYPFAKFTITHKRIQYVAMFNASQKIKSYDNPLLIGFQRKHGTFNFLNIILTKAIHIGFFEAILWETTTETENNKFSAMYFVPVIYSRLPFVGFNSDHNALIGTNIKFIPHKQIQFYAQFAFDGKYQNSDTVFKKTAFQIGGKYFEPLGVKNLYFQAEYNQASPYMYASENAKQNFTFYNQPMAHILGANFKEFLSILTYRYQRFSFSYKFNHITQGADSMGTHYGSNIYLSDSQFSAIADESDFATGRGVRTKIIHHALSFSYTVNPRNNMQIFASYNYRLYKNELVEKRNSYFYVGIRTSISNFYTDF